MFRTTAKVIGILFLICTGATLLSFPFSGAVLEEADYLTRLAGSGASVTTGTILEFIWAISCAGIAIGFYTVLRKYNRMMALSSVGLRVIEAVFVLVGTVCILSLMSANAPLVAL